ncbi:MAG: hypothetical protein E7426_00360 [Ruminococcaceae bacterium]|jgi:predicted DNA-binding protein (MmcQ/YjbR family)|nr:hypothetical protein [Oscillospiraceae bacterium]
MSMESELFSNYLILQDALLTYGFQPLGDRLVFVKPLPEDHFEIILEYDGALRGRIMDLAAGEEYINYRREGATGYSAGIRQKFTDLLLDIRETCCRNQYFRSPQARRINESIGEAFGGQPEFLWAKFPSYAVFRQKDSRKWYALMGEVPRYKLDPASGDRADVEIINVKVNSDHIKDILAQRGYYPAFHMNKKCWVSIILDDTLPDEEILARIAGSCASI